VIKDSKIGGSADIHVTANSLVAVAVGTDNSAEISFGTVK